MKRYILLAGNTYYPAKWSDFAGDFDTIKEAKDFFSEIFKTCPEFTACGLPFDNGLRQKIEWGEIVDTTTKMVVADFWLLSGRDSWRDLNHEMESISIKDD